MPQQTVSLLGRFSVPPEKLWTAIADHEGLSRWSSLKVKVIADPGDGGVGTVRRVSKGGLRIDEEVTYFDPPHRMVYRAVRGLPVSYHQGEIVIEPWETGSQLRWNVTLASPVPGLARVASNIVRTGLNDALKRLHASLES